MEPNQKIMPLQTGTDNGAKQSNQVSNLIRNRTTCLKNVKYFLGASKPI